MYINAIEIPVVRPPEPVEPLFPPPKPIAPNPKPIEPNPKPIEPNPNPIEPKPPNPRPETPENGDPPTNEDGPNEKPSEVGEMIKEFAKDQFEDGLKELACDSLSVPQSCASSQGKFS